MIVIEKGIPIPGPKEKQKFYDLEIQEALSKMNVDDSFLLLYPETMIQESFKQKVMSNIRRFKYRTSAFIEFEIRKTEKGIRVWRIK